MIAALARIPVHDSNHGGLVGWVMWDEFATDLTEVNGVTLPSQFRLRYPGGSDSGQPALTINFAVRDHAIVCTGVNIEANPQGREVLPKDLDSVRTKFSHWSEVAATAILRANRPGLSQEDARGAYRANRKRSRRKINDELLHEVAELYRDNISGNAWEAITTRFGVSEATAGRYIGLARKAGLLPPTDPGKKKA